MQRIKFIVLLANFLFSYAAFCQISEEEILTLLERHELATARERINQAYRQHPNSAVAAYFYAMLEEDGVTALKSFQDVEARFRGTIYAERALFRLGQYHFAEGTYNRARQYFTSLIEQYPNSSLVPQSCYYSAKSLVIIGTLPQAQEELSRCVEKYPGTWMAKFAAEDLARLQPQPVAEREEKIPESPPAPKKPQGIYTVDIGSFKTHEKAVGQQTAFSKAGYPTELREEQKGRKMFYRILVGDFIDRNQARRFADEMQKNFKVKCRVLKRE